jgi:hypothetical protein
MDPAAMHYVTIPARGGSKVTLPFLTQEEADDVERRFAPEPGEPVQAGETQTCPSCGGAGGWNDTEQQKTKSGGTVTVTVVSDEVYAWFAAHGVDEDPDVWGLVTPADEVVNAVNVIASRKI